MRRWAFVPLVAALVAPACLDLGGVDDGSEGPGGGSGGIPADSSFPNTGGTSGAAPDASSGGSAGVASGGSAGSAGSAGPSWTLSTYNTTSGAWSAVPVSSAWSGPNAPPSAGIVAVTQLEHFDRLLVFGEDGNYYVRADGVWQPPMPIATRFPALGALNLNSVIHVSSPPGSPVDETLTFVANPIAVHYEYHSNDATVFVDQVTMADDPAPAAPQASGMSVFDFEIRDPAKYGQAGYYLFYAYYSDGNLYRFDAAFDWMAWPVLESPFWSGKPNAPDPASLRAAWFDAKYARAHFIGLQAP